MTRERLSAAWWLPAVSVFAAGCATPYQSAGSRGGYSDYRVSTDLFAVSFRGNTGTREETVDKYLLRRASEITLEHGFKYFVILWEKERTRSSSVGYSAFKIPLVAPGSSVWIKCFHDRPIDHDLPIDASEFLRFNYPEVLKDFLTEKGDNAGDSR